MLKVRTARPATKTKFQFHNFFFSPSITTFHTVLRLAPASIARRVGRHGRWVIRILRFTVSGQLCQAWIYYNSFIPLLLHGTRHHIAKLSLWLCVSYIEITAKLCWHDGRAREHPLLLALTDFVLHAIQKAVSQRQSKLLYEFYSYLCLCMLSFFCLWEHWQVFLLLSVSYTNIFCGIYTLFALLFINTVPFI